MWIESHQSLRDHPKTRKLGNRVGGVAKAIGHLHCLWWWCLDYAPDGDLTKFDAEDIAIGAEWDGDPHELKAALIDTGFLINGDGLHVHDWYDYAGKLLERKEQNASRMRSMRAAYSDGTIEAVRARDGDNCRYCGRVVTWSDKRGADGGTYDHVIPGGPTTPENLVVCCRGCNSSKRNRTPGEAGLSLIQNGFKTDSIRTSSSTNRPTNLKRGRVIHSSAKAPVDNCPVCAKKREDMPLTPDEEGRPHCSVCGYVRRTRK